MRPPTVLVLLLLVAAPDAAALDLADPAPPLTVTEWLRGGPVDLAELQGQKLAVVAFWATWCPPSIQAIDSLQAVSTKYADRVVVVGVSVADPNNTLDAARQLVEARGDAIGYAVAFEDGETTWKAWMTASGRKAYSTAFVVDRQGRIAWIGDPRRGLDHILEEILAGRYSAAKARRIQDLERRIAKAADALDWQAVLDAADELVADAPGKGHTYRFRALDRLDRAKDAFGAARDGLARGADESETLLLLSRFLIGHRSEGRDFRSLAIEALDRVIELEPESHDIPQRKFELLLEWGRTKQAQEAGAVIVARLDRSAEELNNFAWGLLTEDEKKGKFNPLALLAAERAVALTSRQSWYILDTLALARFEMGEVAEAIRVEEEALALARKEKVGAPQIQSLEQALARFKKGK